MRFSRRSPQAGIAACGIIFGLEAFQFHESMSAFHQALVDRSPLVFVDSSMASGAGMACAAILSAGVLAAAFVMGCRERITWPIWLVLIGFMLFGVIGVTGPLNARLSAMLQKSGYSRCQTRDEQHGSGRSRHTLFAWTLPGVCSSAQGIPSTR